MQLQVLLLQPHHAGTGEDNLQVGVAVVAGTQFAAPVRVLEHLVDEQHLASATLELPGKVCQAVGREIEIVHVDKEAGTVGPELLLGILQQESRLAHSARSLDADEPVVPVNLVHEVAADRGIGMLHKIGVCTVEYFHGASFMIRATKIYLFCRIAKWRWQYFDFY